MKEEDNINKVLGKDNPFRVPEGYFEGFASDLMNRLPEKETLPEQPVAPTMWQRIRPWLYMTAMFVGAALIMRVASSVTPPEAKLTATEEAESEMEYISTALDNSMLDEYSLYVYLDDFSAE